MTRPDMELLHVYGQEAWHDDVRIVGNRAGLEALAALLDVALEKGSAASDHFWVADGEGYGVIVNLMNDGWQSPSWREMDMPYSEDYAK